MALIDAVIEWARNKIDPWQGDAVRRLLKTGNPKLSNEDQAEVYSFAKQHFRLEKKTKGKEPKLPEMKKREDSTEKQASVKLLSIENIKNVNAIKSGQTLSFSPNGLTVIYGDNGSGKSGYCRILKQACRARVKEEILPNVYDKTATGNPSATLKIEQDGELRDIDWVQDEPAVEVLDNITVFDGHCADYIIDKKNEIAIKPFGSEIPKQLAEIVTKVKDDLIREFATELPIHDSNISVNTTSRTFLDSLSESTTDDEIKRATSWTEEDKQKLAYQEELARTSAPQKSNEEQGRLDRIVNRVNGIKEFVVGFDSRRKELTNEALQEALKKVKEAKEARKLAKAQQQTKEPLDVTYSNPWEVLYKAAREFSTTSAYPEDPFPKTDVKAVCVLCQQQLKDSAVERFKRFRLFMEDKTTEHLELASNALKQLQERFSEITLWSESELKSNVEDVADQDPKVAGGLEAFHTAVVKRKNEAVALLTPDKDPQEAEALSPWPESLEKDLNSIIDKVNAEITKIKEASKQEKHDKLTAEIEELKSRKALSDRKEEISRFVASKKHNAALQNASDSFNTTAISQFGTKVYNDNVSFELNSVLKNELDELGVNIKITQKTRSTAGKTEQEMNLAGASLGGSTHVSNVLSEGEARVISIAGFLADISLAHHSNPIVLDDPVSSLDHKYTSKVAKRLADEGLQRQVIIFTHNVSFLVDLKSALDSLIRTGSQVELTVHDVQRKGDLAGVASNGEPWHNQKTKQRVNTLSEELGKIKGYYEENQTLYNEKAVSIYALLRAAWESCIEEVLFFGTVQRHRNSVKTNQLKGVTVEDSDYNSVLDNMTHISQVISAHDSPKPSNSNLPSPEDLKADIKKLHDFQLTLVRRRKDTENRRKKTTYSTP